MCGVYYAVIVYLTPNDNVSEYNAFWVRHDAPALIAICGIDLVLNTSLLFIFVCKLKQILQLKYNIDPSVYSALVSHKGEGSQPHELLKLMTRHTILFGIAIITNQIWSISVLLQLNRNINLIVSNFCFRALENTANCMVLFLSLKANEKWYLWLCRICHTQIQNCFIKSLDGNDSSVSMVQSGDVDC